MARAGRRFAAGARRSTRVMEATMKVRHLPGEGKPPAPAGTDGAAEWVGKTIHTSALPPAGPLCWRLAGGRWDQVTDPLRWPGGTLDPRGYDALLEEAGYAFQGGWGREFGAVSVAICAAAGERHLIAVTLCDAIHHLLADD